MVGRVLDEVDDGGVAGVKKEKEITEKVKEKKTWKNT